MSVKKKKSSRAAKSAEPAPEAQGAVAVAEPEVPGEPIEPEEGFVGEQTPEEEEAAAQPAPASRDPKGHGLALRVDPEKLKERPDFNPNDFKESNKQVTHAERIADSRKALKQPLPAGSKFFEAPDGYIIVGDAKRDYVHYRYGNDGKGMLINPKR